MSNKRPFDDVMREFIAEHPDEIDHLTPEQLAERTGYSMSTAREYLHRRSLNQTLAKRAKEAGAVTYVASSGNVRVIYYPLLGEAKIMSSYRRKREFSEGYERGFSESV